MASTTIRVLDRATLREGDTLSLDQAPDLGDYGELHLILTIHQGTEGDAPALIFRHAPVAEDDAWLDFPEPIRVSLLRTDRLWFSPARHTRYLGWSPAGHLDGEVIVTLDVVART